MLGSYHINRTQIKKAYILSKDICENLSKSVSY
jgi:hypothetical protein